MLKLQKDLRKVHQYNKVGKIVPINLFSSPELGRAVETERGMIGTEPWACGTHG
jgi:hypothetical protein